MSISVLNTDAGLSGKTIANLEDAQTITGAKNFDRDPSAPFTVSANSAVVTNLDADSVDGVHVSSGTFTPVLAFGGLSTGITYGTQVGTYFTIGSLTHVEIRLILTSKGSATGAATITGLQNAPNATGGAIAIIDPVASLTTTHNPWAAVGSGTTMTLFQGNRTALDDTAFANTTELRISATYRT